MSNFDMYYGFLSYRKPSVSLHDKNDSTAVHCFGTSDEINRLTSEKISSTKSSFSSSGSDA